MSAARRNRRRPGGDAPQGTDHSQAEASSQAATPSRAEAGSRPRRAPQHRRAADGLPTVAQILQWTTLGTAVFTVVAVSRSRADEMDLPGLFFLSGSVEPAVRRRLLILLTMQVLVGIAAASSRPFTVVAFCTLTPIFALGMMALCGATHGHFPARRS